MSGGVVITEQYHAKDGWNLAHLDSPLFLLGGHRFLPGPRLVAMDAASFNTRAQSLSLLNVTTQEPKRPGKGDHGRQRSEQRAWDVRACAWSKDNYGCGKKR